ncbi:MAG TPA: carbohydrate ABC transporter permease [Devosia sp.]|jgi:raffinose/stachyose/melibiose transport system permease protein|uniref:carbohydrate ABC transporter permease n=1 Tax=Devosia sp. TaxID=1871048 RepID=UPI002DDCB64E|nr:carbohydrate ABC transporter permease [Devosia sp.]HEV2515704.1 carbohydrate ABC transporter permease [Devosia sp.]
MATASRKRRPAISVVQWITLLVVAAFVIVPFYTTALGGFKEIGELRVNPFGLPQSWDPVRFAEIIGGPRYVSSLLNSLLVALGSVVLSTLLASMTAFAFAHIKFFGSRFLMSYLMLGLLFPSATAILPLFIKMRDLGLLDSHLGIIIAQVAFSISFSVLLFYNFFKELPKELIDAARMDNCGYIRIYWYVTLPLCLPIIATVGVFNFVGSWNSFLLPLIVLNSDAKYTWPLGIMQFQGQYGSDWPRILAFLTLSILPAIAFFLLAQRYVISGLTGGAVKG